MPLDLFKEKFMTKKASGKVVKDDVPDWMTHMPRGAKQLKQALAYCKEQEIDPPWMTE